MPVSVVLTESGADRATAYAMSAKVVRRGPDYLCTWLGQERRNWWALVDAERGVLREKGPVGPVRRDNHCGAGLCLAPDGTAHLVVGGHHEPFLHYRLPASANPAAWELLGEAGGPGGTYPSVTCDAEGVVHLAYRCRELTPGMPFPYHLMYARWEPDAGAWDGPRPLVRAAIEEHTWLTNVLETGPGGTVQVFVSNTRKLPDGSYYYGAAALCSGDGGEQWHQAGAQAPLALPVDMGELEPLDGPNLARARIQPPQQWQQQAARGPGQYYYNEILLSNPVIDEQERPWVILHNLLLGEAALFHQEGDGFVGLPLAKALGEVAPGYRISHAGQLSRHRNGTLQAILTVAPEGVREFGAVGTAMVRLLVRPEGEVTLAEFAVEPAADGTPDWLPSLERWSWQAPFDRPALLHTHGHNAGGYEHNVNDLMTTVRLQLPH